MTRTVRFVSTFFGYVFTIPFVLLVHFLRLLIGKQNAVRLTGKLVTKMAALGMGILIPRAKSAFEFDSFKKTLKNNFYKFINQGIYIVNKILNVIATIMATLN